MYDREVLLTNISAEAWKGCAPEPAIAYADIQDLDFSNTNLIVLLFALADMIARNKNGDEDYMGFKTDIEDMIIWLHGQQIKH